MATVLKLCPRMAMDMASGQPVFLSLSFMRWRRECIVSFLSVIIVLRRFISIAEAASLPRGRACLGNIASPSSLPFLYSCSVSAALCLNGSVLFDPFVFRPLMLFGFMVIERSCRFTSYTSSPTISDSLAPVSIKVTKSAQASGSF